MWGGQQGGGSRDVLENGLKGLTEFLRAPRLPGKARLNRREAAEDAPADQAGPSHGGGGSAGSSGYASSSDPSQHKQPQQQQHKQQQGQQQGQHQHQQQQHPHHHQQQQQQQQGATSPLAAGDGALASALADLRMHGSGEPSTSAPEAAPAAADAAPAATALVSSSRASSAIRVAKFRRILSEPVVDLDALRELSWSGVPPELRPLCWRLLLGYLPPNRARQAGVLLRKRREYADMVPEFYDIENSERSEDEIGALRQVTVDVPRTAPSVPFFQEPIIQNSLRRMLYIWGIRHPASGYVQGMNDLVTPFLAVFLSDALGGSMSEWGAADLTEEVMLDVEADCYWCLCRLLEGIQDHYTYAQPGIQRTVFRLKELVRKQHEPLVAHMEHEGVDFLQFAFRWVNCLLIREVPFDSALRLWDTYLAEGPGFADFLVYVCAAFLARWERQLIGLEFQELMLFLQRLPTQSWGDAEMESVLSAAFVLRNVWQHAQSHLQA